MGRHSTIAAITPRLVDEETAAAYVGRGRDPKFAKTSESALPSHSDTNGNVKQGPRLLDAYSLTAAAVSVTSSGWDARTSPVSAKSARRLLCIAAALHYDQAGKRKDLYVKLPAPTDPRFAIELARVNAEYAAALPIRATHQEHRQLLGLGNRVSAPRSPRAGRRSASGRLAPASRASTGPLNTLDNYLRYVMMFEDPDFVYENQKTKKRTPVRDLDVKGIRPVHIHELRDGLAETQEKRTTGSMF